MPATIEQPTLFEFRDQQFARTADRPQGRQEAPAERALHMHSLEAQDAHAAAFRGRRGEIVAWLRENGSATDRQVKDALFGDRGDMNMVRPRITELIAAGICHEIGSVVDDVTGMHVRIVRAKSEQEVRLEGIR